MFWEVAIAWVLLAVLFVILVYDFVAAMYGPANATVSSYVQSLSVRFPVVPLLVGLVIGHLFWPVQANGVRK